MNETIGSIEHWNTWTPGFTSLTTATSGLTFKQLAALVTMSNVQHDWPSMMRDRIKRTEIASIAVDMAVQMERALAEAENAQNDESSETA